MRQLDNYSYPTQRRRERRESRGCAEENQGTVLFLPLRFLSVRCAFAVKMKLALLSTAFLAVLACNISIAWGLSVNEVPAPQRQGPKRPGDYIPEGPKRPGVIEPAETPQSIREDIHTNRTPQKGSLVLF